MDGRMPDADPHVTEPLVLIPGQCPRTASGALGVIMLYVSGVDEQAQYFTHRAGYFQPLLTVAWPLGTMQAILPETTATALLVKQYARPMTDEEARAYNEGLEPDLKQPEPEQPDEAVSDEPRPARRGRPRKGE
jgi:hypothetical protein